MKLWRSIVPSSRQCLSKDDGLDDEREDDGNCSVLYCVMTVVYSDIHTRAVFTAYCWFRFTLLTSVKMWIWSQSLCIGAHPRFISVSSCKKKL